MLENTSVPFSTTILMWGLSTDGGHTNVMGLDKLTKLLAIHFSSSINN